MDEREKEIAEIKIRMKELGYNQRSLSMKLFGKPDRLRNLFEGKSKNLRADTHKAIMKELWPEKIEPFSLDDIHEREMGMFRSIEAIMQALLDRQILPKADLENSFNYHLRELRLNEGKPIAAEVLDQFLDFLHSKPFGEAIANRAQSLQPQQDQSKKTSS